MSGMGASRPPQSLRCVAIETPTAGGRAATAKTTGPPVQAPRKLPASASSRKAHDNAGSRGLCCMCGSDQLLEIPTGPQKPTRCWTYATYCQRHSCSIGRDAQSQPSTPCKTHGPRAKLTDPVQNSRTPWANAIASAAGNRVGPRLVASITFCSQCGHGKSNSHGAMFKNTWGGPCCRVKSWR